MSAPTKIYLVVVSILLAVWLGISNFVDAGGDGRMLVTDPDYLLNHSEEFSGSLRGRVEIRNAAGEEVAPPEGTLVIDVHARDRDGVLARRKIGEVGSDGLFEIAGLPPGLATVAVLLGGGEVIWQCDDVVVGGAGTLDPRIDPIDLGSELYSFDIAVFGPTGEAAHGGQLAWRPVGVMDDGDDMTFHGVAPISADGHARFFTRSPGLDAVALVPGARPELFEQLYQDSSIDLGPGIVVRIEATGELPDPERWIVRAMLIPVDLQPSIEVKNRGFDLQDGLLFGELKWAMVRDEMPFDAGEAEEAAELAAASLVRANESIVLPASFGPAELTESQSAALRVLNQADHGRPLLLERKVGAELGGAAAAAGSVELSNDTEDGPPYVEIPVSRGGRYQVTWRVLRRDRHRFSTVKLKDDGEDIVVPMVPGTATIKRPFPMNAFLRKAPSGR